MKRKHILKIALVSFFIVFTSGISLAQQATVTINQDSKIPTLLSLKKELEKDKVS